MLRNEPYVLVFAFQKQFSEICECLDLNGTYKVDAEGISMYLYFRFVCAQFYYHKCYICAKQLKPRRHFLLVIKQISCLRGIQFSCCLLDAVQRSDTSQSWLWHALATHTVQHRADVHVQTNLLGKPNLVETTCPSLLCTVTDCSCCVYRGAVIAHTQSGTEHTDVDVLRCQRTCGTVRDVTVTVLETCAQNMYKQVHNDENTVHVSMDCLLLT
ncbi:hypothetical protein F2P81_009105 [Scophthalmus maximus]|uniref:Uncharacterized protein n=1 Tax=Scophthalmus maximus TaxID=52904 RepID=A0A6A4T678_SCOMX|nr:hypothetical protein F2P81_009105 [Scophthalmus maximus]